MHLLSICCVSVVKVLCQIKTCSQCVVKQLDNMLLQMSVSHFLASLAFHRHAHT